jgi:hypothetical protein
MSHPNPVLGMKETALPNLFQRPFQTRSDLLRAIAISSAINPVNLANPSQALLAK